jgi:hypothetical protein
MSMGVPYYGQFIGERPGIGGGNFADLPNFGAFTFSHATVQYYVPIHTYTNNIGSSYANLYTIQYFTNSLQCNSNVLPDIGNGSPSNGGFSETRLRSTYT